VAHADERISTTELEFTDVALSQPLNNGHPAVIINDIVPRDEVEWAQ
jgi:hypothetical protein